MFDLDGKIWERPHPDLVTTIPGFHTRIRARVVFHLGKAKKLGDAFAGLLRVFWLEDKGAKSRGPLQKRNFQAGLRKAHPQIA
jgi:hypothetical protein